MAVARVYCKGLSIEDAITQTLHTGIHCSNPDAIPATQLGHLYETVSAQVDPSLKQIG